MSLQLLGIHHLTAITADVVSNNKFYTDLLGLRLVKKTVNQDDVSAYHLFYADGVGSPGTDITFFDWPAAREKRGTNSITRTHLRVESEASLEFWAERFAINDIPYQGPFEQNDRHQISFEDPEGQRLALTVDSNPSYRGQPWEKSSIQEEHQIIGLGPIELTVSESNSLDVILSELLSMTKTHEYRQADSAEFPTFVYQMSKGGAHAELHVTVRNDKFPARNGAGGVHHVALRTPNVDEYNQWAERIKSYRVPFSGPVDRFYFQSLYFRAPFGILFEIATDGPGFDIDEDRSSMGERLSLPPFLEHRRSEIENRLKPLK